MQPLALKLRLHLGRSISPISGTRKASGSQFHYSCSPRLSLNRGDCRSCRPIEPEDCFQVPGENFDQTPERGLCVFA
jgi:hypothetical protein